MLKSPSEFRKDKATRRAHASVVDAATLCSPNAASIEAVSLVVEDNDHAVLIGASADFRCDDDWARRFPGLNEKQCKDACSSMRIFAVVRGFLTLDVIQLVMLI